MIKISLKPKNYQNNPKTYKMTKYAQNPKNDQNIPRNPKNDQNTLKNLKITKNTPKT